jgi:hypothetical protein
MSTRRPGFVAPRPEPRSGDHAAYRTAPTPSHRQRRRRHLVTLVATCCVGALATTLALAVTSRTPADAGTSRRVDVLRTKQFDADLELARQLVPASTPEGLARDAVGHPMSTKFSMATRWAMAVQEARARELAARWQAAVQARAAQDAVWDRLAQCETGGNWSMRGSRFSGGLGFYNRTWDSFGGREFAPNAGMATREQQITVAERVRARFGYTGWGCAPRVGL